MITCPINSEPPPTRRQRSGHGHVAPLWTRRREPPSSYRDSTPVLGVARARLGLLHACTRLVEWCHQHGWYPTSTAAKGRCLFLMGDPDGSTLCIAVVKQAPFTFPAGAAPPCPPHVSLKLAAHRPSFQSLPGNRNGPFQPLIMRLDLPLSKSLST